MLCVSSPTLAKHKPPSKHPEHPDRIVYMWEDLERCFGKGIVTVWDPKAAKKDLYSVHSRQYIDYLFSIKDTTYLDYETVMSESSLEGVLTAAGICLELMEYILTGNDTKGFALIRPPGHHAGNNRGMGYCIVNNMAIAVQKALLLNLQRIAIIDWDVHHGNGTQELFEETDKVFFIDMHQENLFPCQSGGADEIGSYTGRGFTLNIPLPPGSGRSQYLDCMYTRIYPALKAYKPQLLCVSSGFDAVAGDLEGGMSLSPQDFGVMTKIICAWADEFCEGKVFMILEGGYRIESVSEALVECIDVLRCWNT